MHYKSSGGFPNMHYKSVDLSCRALHTPRWSGWYLRLDSRCRDIRCRALVQAVSNDG